MLHLEDESFQWWISLHWSRMLYDAFCKPSSSVTSVFPPVVVDAEDVVHNTTAVTGKLCDIFSVNQSGIRETWDPGFDRPLPEGTVPNFIEELRTSTGVIRKEGRVRI